MISEPLLLAVPAAVHVFLGILGAILLLWLGYLLRHWMRRPPAAPAAPSLEDVLLGKDVGAGMESPEAAGPLPAGPAASAEAPTSAELPFAAEPAVGVRILQGALVVLACVVAAGFLLILLPEKTIDTWAEALRLRAASPAVQEEPIALLYLGDEIAGKEFHIRGVVRNVSTRPIEKLDAVIRLYAADGMLVETAVVRMDAETIAPDATATFHLVYPDYQGQFTSYAADFKLRQGDPVRFKDMRGAR